MKKSFILTVTIVSLLILISGCEKSFIDPNDDILKENSTNLSVNSEAVAKEIISKANWTIDESMEIPKELSLSKVGAANSIQTMDRQRITGNIVHYKFIVKTGPGHYDQIGIHRVVKERRAFRPIRTEKTLFYQHGDAKDFQGMTLPGTVQPNTANDFGFAIFLAQNNVDVWGIDQAWTLVPEGVTDFGFMADWGIQKQIDDLHFAMGIARFVRGHTGNGFGKLILCGYSSGVATGFSLLNAETQMPRILRNVKAFIPVDLSIKTDNSDFSQLLQGMNQGYKARLNNGDYGDLVPFPILANLARTDPNGDSPIIPGLTNMQAALFFGAGNIFGVIPTHYHAGIWENNFPVNFQYITIDQWLDFMEAAVYVEPVKFMADYTGLISDAEDLPFDDYFAQIRVPILNVAPAGGFGELSIYGTTFLGSSDIIHLIPRLHPVGNELFDFAHIDVFTANNAEALVWQPILDWIGSH